MLSEPFVPMPLVRLRPALCISPDELLPPRLCSCSLSAAEEEQEEEGEEEEEEEVQEKKEEEEVEESVG